MRRGPRVTLIIATIVSAAIAAWLPAIPAHARVNHQFLRGREMRSWGSLYAQDGVRRFYLGSLTPKVGIPPLDNPRPPRIFAPRSEVCIAGAEAVQLKESVIVLPFLCAAWDTAPSDS